MNFVVVGCGRVGAELAYRLYQKGHRVTVVDIVEEAFTNLPHDFRGRTVVGEALNSDVLHRAGFENADGVATVTNSDSLNAVVAHLARTVYQTPNVFARNYDTSFRPVYDAFDLQVISSSSWGAQRLEELLSHSEMHSVFSAGNGEVEVYEFVVPAAWSGKTIKDLLPDEQVTPISLTHNGRAVIPSLDTGLLEGDLVVVGATFEGIKALRTRMVELKEG